MDPTHRDDCDREPLKNTELPFQKFLLPPHPTAPIPQITTIGMSLLIFPPERTAGKKMGFFRHHSF